MQPNNPNQFTEKALATIAQLPEIVKQARKQQLESEHLAKALLDQPDGLALRILKKCDVNVAQLRDRVEEFINRQPKLTNSSVAV